MKDEHFLFPVLLGLFVFSFIINASGKEGTNGHEIKAIGVQKAGELPLYVAKAY